MRLISRLCRSIHKLLLNSAAPPELAVCENALPRGSSTPGYYLPAAPQLPSSFSILPSRFSFLISPFP
jgi:hypothetical protein